MSDELGLLEDDKERAIVIRVDTVVDEARSREIKDEGQYKMMADFLLTIKSLMKDIKDYWDPSIRNANKTVKDLRAKKSAQITPLESADLIANQKMNTWRKGIEDRNREVTKKRVEQERVYAEAVKKAREEHARKQAEEEAKAEAEDSDVVKGVEYLAPAVPDIIPEVVQELPKVPGISYAEHWVWECTDFLKVPDEYKVLDKVKINGLVRAMKNDTNIPGIRPYDDKTLRARV